MPSGWAGTPVPVRPDATSGAFLDFDLVADPNGNLGLLWQAFSGVGADAAFALYDAANSSWGAGSLLTSDGSLEESFAPALTAGGTLYVAYDKVAMEWVTETVEISPTLTISVSHVPRPVQTDLYLLSHTIERDLGIGSGDLAFSGGDPAPGSSVVVSATVHNLGDLAVTGGQVAFYDGDPGAGGVQIGATQALVTPFRAAMTDTVHVTWNVPPGNVPHTVYAVVDPSGAIAEADESNNTASRGAVLPDLAVAWAHSAHTTTTVTLTATIANGGHSPAPAPFAVAFRAEDPVTGTLLGTAGVGSAVAAGGRVTVEVALDDPAQAAGAGDRFWAVADSGSAVAEADEDNNAGYAALDILPDLTLAALDIQGNGPITVTVHNVGVLTATEVALTVWRDAPGGAVLYHGLLGAVGPGGSAYAVLDLPAGLVEVWAKVDPDDGVAESDESNNLAVRWRGAYNRVYLPLVVRRAE
jgi:CARDB